MEKNKDLQIPDSKCDYCGQEQVTNKIYVESSTWKNNKRTEGPFFFCDYDCLNFFKALPKLERRGMN